MIDCKLCKGDTQQTADCSLLPTKGWKGLTVENLGKEDKAMKVVGKPGADTHAALDDVLGAIRGESPAATGSGKGKLVQGARGSWKTCGGNRGGRGAGRGGGRGRQAPQT